MTIHLNLLYMAMPYLLYFGKHNPLRCWKLASGSNGRTGTKINAKMAAMQAFFGGKRGAFARSGGVFSRSKTAGF